MVSLGKEREELMGMGPAERSNPLHNFTTPWLKWGSRKVMRCMKVNNNSNGLVSATAFDRRRSSERSLIGRSRDFELDRRGSTDRRREIFRYSPSPAPLGGSERKSKKTDDGIEAVREKLMFDLQTAADKMKDAFLRDGRLQEQQEHLAPVNAASPSVDEASKPWNLRTRRAACKAPPTSGITGGGGYGGGGGGGKGFQDELPKSEFAPFKTEATKSPRLLRGSAVAATGTAAAGASSSGEKRERAKFSVSLSRQEIEDDFMAITGHRLPRRPKKRPKIVQKQLDVLFPGLWMTEISADFYKVPDAA